MKPGFRSTIGEFRLPVKKLVSSDLFPLFVAVAAGPLFVFPRERWLWILPAVPLVWLLRGLFGLPWLRKTPADLALAVLAVWILLGTLRLPDIGPSVDKLAGFVYGVVVFYAVLEAARKPGRLRAGIVLFLMAGAVIAVVGTLGRRATDLFTPVPHIEMNIAGAANGVNPNPLGGTLLLFLPLGLALVPHFLKKENGPAGEKARRPALLFVLLIVALELAAIVFARSFGAWAALFFSLLIIGRKKRLLKGIIGIGLIAAVAFLWLKINRPIADIGENLRGTMTKSVSSRFPIWAAGIKAIHENPVFGVGMDRFRLGEGIDYDLAHAHNQFLHTAAETGIPGLAAYLAVLIAAGWMAIQVGRSKKSSWMKSAVLGLTVGQIGFAVFGLADAIALGAKPGLFFWISLSLIAAIYLSADEGAPCS